MNGHLYRIQSRDDGTFGVLVIEGLNWGCFTAELPWRDNKPNISCIPEGSYTFEPRESPSRGLVYQARRVEGRSLIQIHIGNFAGDVNKGFRSDVKGCIVTGDRMMKIYKQLAVANSRGTFEDFKMHVGDGPLRLKIHWAQYGDFS